MLSRATCYRYAVVVWGVLYIAPPSRTATYPLFEAGGTEFGLGVPSLMFAWGVTEVGLALCAKLYFRYHVRRERPRASHGAVECV